MLYDTDDEAKNARIELDLEPEADEDFDIPERIDKMLK